MSGLWDALAVLGGAALCWGLYLVYPPLAPLAAGAALVALAVVGARRWRGQVAGDDLARLIEADAPVVREARRRLANGESAETVARAITNYDPHRDRRLELVERIEEGMAGGEGETAQ